MKHTCAYPYCSASPRTDVACVLHRISPKGQPFIGLCSEHYRQWIASGLMQAERVTA